MAHYRMLDRNPSVLITSNRNELKLYDGNIVYLNNGDNFELRFFNPLQEKIGVEVMFNGVKKGDSYLVLNPGQDLTLDRFLDTNRKMLFDTYQVNGNSKEAMEAIEKNGLISFNFYKEKSWYRNNNDDDVNVKYGFPDPNNGNVWNDNFTTFSTTNANTRGYSKNIGSFISGVDINKATKKWSPITENSGDMDLQSSYSDYVDNHLDKTIDYSQYVCESENPIEYADYIAKNTTNEVTLDSLSLETGRIERGDESEQKLKTVNVEFETVEFLNLTYQMLPKSTMATTPKEIRNYCTTCSYRIRNNKWQYCPKCGNKLD